MFALLLYFLPLKAIGFPVAKPTGRQTFVIKQHGLRYNGEDKAILVVTPS
jgi:hypothetical protein